jgi:hypothetical protein
MDSGWIGCDACASAQALYQVKMIAGELYFCGHHYNKNKEALDKQAFEIVELDSKQLVETEIVNG